MPVFPCCGKDGAGDDKAGCEVMQVTGRGKVVGRLGAQWLRAMLSRGSYIPSPTPHILAAEGNERNPLGFKGSGQN